MAELDVVGRIRPSFPRRILGRIFNTPIVIEGVTWIPVVQLGAWIGMSWHAGRDPELTYSDRMVRGALTMGALLGSEWGHNLAHVFAAQLIGKSMDELRILWGLPRCVYYDLNDPTTNPREHILRALAGPLFNFTSIPLLWIARTFAHKETHARAVADTALVTNLFLGTISLLPIPGIDGGPLLKWSLVNRGSTSEDADEVVRKVNGVLGLVLGFISWTMFKKRRSFLGIILSLLSILSIGVFARLIKEEEAPF